MNTISSFRELHQRKKKELAQKENENKESTYLEKMLTSISMEIRQMDAHSLLKTVNPEIEAIEEIEQIQNYCNLIEKEISSIKQDESENRKYIHLIKKQEEKVLHLFQPKKITYDVKTMQQDGFGGNNRKSSGSPDQPKPAIDYKLRIKQLEKDIHTTRQSYDDTKTKNKALRKELDEMRKNVTINREKFRVLYNEFVLCETAYWDEKKDVVKKISGKHDSDELQFKLNEKKKELESKNIDMIKKIKKTDNEMTLLLAEKKFYEHEKSKLIEKEKKIIEKWNKEREKFYNKNKEDINKMSSYSGKSKVLDLLLGEKIDYFEQVISKLSQETNIDEITKLVEYFINSTKECKNHEDFIVTLQKNVNSLEKEVEELEHLINFFEHNLENCHAEQLINETDLDKLEFIKKQAEDFINIQYEVLVEKYKNYCDKIRACFNNLFPNSPEANLGNLNNLIDKYEIIDFAEFAKKMFGRLQDLIKDNYRAVKSNVTIETNSKELVKGKLDIINQIDNEFKDKSDKIREAAQTFYEKSGVRLSVDNIRGIVKPILNDDKDKKRKKEFFK